jgi:hypothetical protein
MPSAAPSGKLLPPGTVGVRKGSAKKNDSDEYDDSNSGPHAVLPEAEVDGDDDAAVSEEPAITATAAFKVRDIEAGPQFRTVLEQLRGDGDTRYRSTWAKCGIVNWKDPEPATDVLDQLMDHYNVWASFERFRSTMK